MRSGTQRRNSLRIPGLWRSVPSQTHASCLLEADCALHPRGTNIEREISRVNLNHCLHGHIRLLHSRHGESAYETPELYMEGLSREIPSKKGYRPELATGIAIGPGLYLLILVLLKILLSLLLWKRATSEKFIL